MKKRFWDWVRRTLGYKYILNTRSMEVHLADSTNKACGLDKMAEHNKVYITEAKFKKLMSGKSGVNGCRFCMKDHDKEGI